MLNEGFDVPDCEALIFLRPTDSERIWLQQLGRGLRKKEGKETVLVLDFV
jgi:superfamily II DNA or RNA helicase